MKNLIRMLQRFLRLTATVILLGVINSVMAQPPNWLTNGNVATSQYKLGYSGVSTFPLQFWNASAERMRIAIDGNVGIGTTVTPSKLNVNGAINSSLINNTTDGTIIHCGSPESGNPNLGLNDGFVMRWQNDFFGPLSTNEALVFEKTDFNGTSPDGGFAFVNTGNSGTYGTGLDGTSMVIRGNGHVGIGNIYGPSILPVKYFPGNMLEINGTPSSVANTGESGLSFKNLNANSVKQPLGQGQGLLSVDAQGKVIYVPNTGTGGAFIGLCPALPQLTGDAGMTLNGRNFLFDGSIGNVGVGVPCGTNPTARLDVFTKREKIGVKSIVATGINNLTTTAFYGEANASDRSNIGANLLATGVGIVNFGIQTKAENATSSNYGIKAVAGPCTSTTLAQASVGISTEACGSLGSNIGIYAKAPNAGQFGNDWAGYFSGYVYISGGLQVASDGKLKRDIQPISSALQMLDRLNPKAYYFRTDEFAALNLPTSLQYGVIADEVEAILPEAVKAVRQPAQLDEEGKEIVAAIDFKSVNYTTFIPILIQGVKEQQEQIAARDQQIAEMQKQFENLQAQMAVLANQVKSCCAFPESMNKGSEPANSLEENHLEQNFPNPFSERTVIRYHVARAMPQTYLRITTLTGIEISNFPITASGDGQVKLSANSLAAGTYLYELVVNGEHVATRKMELTK